MAVVIILSEGNQRVNCRKMAYLSLERRFFIQNRRFYMSIKLLRNKRVTLCIA